MKEESGSPLIGVIASTILGSPGFVRKKSQELIGKKEADRNMLAIMILTRPTMDEIIDTVEKVFGKGASQSRKICIYFCHRYSGARLKEIGEKFELSDAGGNAGKPQNEDCLGERRNSAQFCLIEWRMV